MPPANSSQSFIRARATSLPFSRLCASLQSSKGKARGRGRLLARASRARSLRGRPGGPGTPGAQGDLRRPSFTREDRQPPHPGEKPGDPRPLPPLSSNSELTGERGGGQAETTKFSNPPPKFSTRERQVKQSGKGGALGRPPLSSGLSGGRRRGGNALPPGLLPRRTPTRGPGGAGQGAAPPPPTPSSPARTFPGSGRAPARR